MSTTATLVEGHHLIISTQTRTNGVVTHTAACECKHPLTWDDREKEHALHLLTEARAVGARSAWTEALSAADDLVRELTANIPLSKADPAWDPNDEFKRCAVDRMERAKRWRQQLITRAEQAGANGG